MIAGSVARTRNQGRYYGNGRTWMTPPELFAELNKEFDFTLDPCCSKISAKCLHFFTEEQNGLLQSWACQRVFMNPPYGKEIYAWTSKAKSAAAFEKALVVGLLPASTDLAWWHDDVLAANAEIRYIRKRVRFVTEDGKWASGMFPSVVVIWRPL